jgi:hypothetical protein
MEPMADDRVNLDVENIWGEETSLSIAAVGVNGRPIEATLAWDHDLLGPVRVE